METKDLNMLWTLEEDAAARPAWAENMAETAASPLMQELCKANKATRQGWALDLGCGTGRAFLPLVEAGYWVIGIDPTVDCIRKSQQRTWQAQLSAYPILAGAARLPIRSDAFDFMLAISCLFHLSIAELTNALREIQRVLMPGGRAILHFLDLDDWRHTLARKISPEDATIPSYRSVVTCFCSPEKIREWITQAGLKLEKLELRSNATNRGQQCNWLAHCTV